MNDSQKVYYFAYGSNLDKDQMKRRCPSAEFKCRAVLKDYRLAFTRYSSSWKGGVADVVEQPGATVWGVVYTISQADMEKNLDRYEGYDPQRDEDENCYIRKECKVYCEGDENRPLTAWIYVAVKQPDKHLPSKEYMESIIGGARYWKLPQEYIEQLEAIEVQS